MKSSVIIPYLLLMIFVMVGYIDVSRSRYARAVVWTSSMRWPGGIIPYVIDKEAFSKEKDASLVLEAMNTWNMETCVEFRRKRPSDKNWIKITGGVNCHSFVGLNDAGEQIVNLSDPDCRYYGTYLHEFGHVIGLHHEHIRPGRDRHLRINHGNIEHGLSEFYEKINHSELMDFHLPYDLQSVMHYGSQSFTGADGKSTIDVKNEVHTHLLDEVHNKDISFLDAKVVNLFYNCSSRCKEKISCPSMGYVDQFCKCHVPENFATRRCQDKLEKAWCMKQQEEGECETKPAYMAVYCRKTCEKCYKYKVKFQSRKKICKNFDKDSKCDSWAKRGECEKNNGYMRLKCKKSCGYCKKRQYVPKRETNCRNIYGDFECVQLVSSGECKTNKNFMEINCPKACGLCNSTHSKGVCQGDDKRCMSCRNLKDDATCKTWLDQGHCHTKKGYMKFQCRKACGWCSSTKKSNLSHILQKKNPNLTISCENVYSDRKCKKFKISGDCMWKPNFMLAKCAKFCGNCPIRNESLHQSNCTNIESDESCSELVKEGICKRGLHGKKHVCEKSCNFCKQNNTGCRNLEKDENCDNWSRNGNCSKGGNFMMINCGKACGRCQNDSYVECVDQYNPRFCQILKSFGKCHKNPSFMLHMCAQTCGSCDLIGKNITNVTCINAMDDHFCEMWKDDGECKSNPIFMKRNCEKSCGVCHSFVRRSKHYKICKDNNSEESCSRFKSKGLCKDKWKVKVSKCFKTCGYCQAKKNVTTCSNVYSDKVCEKWRRGGKCKKDKVFMEHMCAKSCNYCKGGVGIITCKNLQDDKQCDIWTKEDKCTENPDYMLIMCARSCKNCSKHFQTIRKERECKNNGDDAKCDYWSTINECVKNPKYMLKVCRKSCGVCKSKGFTGLSICKNKDDDSTCDQWSARGECEKNPDYMLINCAKSCQRCPTSQPSIKTSIITTSSLSVSIAEAESSCTNLYRDDYCEKWEKLGFCKKYPLFMISQCGRTCQTCHKTLECQNFYSNEICEKWANEGKCQSNLKFMLMMCVKSCGKCSVLGLQVDELNKDVTSRCENKYGELSCEAWKEIGECERNSFFMSKQCAKSCGTCQRKKKQTLPDRENAYKSINIENTCDELVKSGHCQDEDSMTSLICTMACKNSSIMEEVKISERCSNLAGNETCRKLKRKGLCEKKLVAIELLCSAACEKCKQYPTKQPKTKCTNRAGDTQCSYWTRQNQCKKNNLYMMHYCKKSCNICSKSVQDEEVCKNNFDETKCLLWSKRGECDRNKMWMNKNCARSCMVCQGNKKHRELQRKCTNKLDCLGITN